MIRSLPWIAGVLLLASCSGSSNPAVARSGSTPVKAAVRPVTAPELHALVSASTAPVVVVNVWATWCGPCREEFPDLVRVYRDYKERGVELVLVSADFDDQLPAVRAFLSRQGVSFDTFIKTGDDMEFIQSMNPQWTGAIPATFVYEGGGGLRHFVEGKGTYEEFARQVEDVLRTKSHAQKEERS